MNNLGEQVNLVINNIAQKLGVAAEKLYPALRKQALIDGITDTIWILVAVITFIVMLKLLTKWVKEQPKLKYNYLPDEFSEMQVFKIVLGVIVEIIAIVVIAISFNPALTALFNPDWYIVNKIISSLK